MNIAISKREGNTFQVSVNGCCKGVFGNGATLGGQLMDDKVEFVKPEAEAAAHLYIIRMEAGEGNKFTLRFIPPFKRASRTRDFDGPARVRLQEGDEIIQAILLKKVA